MSLRTKVIQAQSEIEPYAGGEGRFTEQIRASLPFLHLVPKKKKQGLVVGCGEGYEVKWLQDEGFSVTGITINFAEAEQGLKKYQAKIFVSDMHSLPFTEGVFDWVYAANILEHSVAPYLALQEWRRVLKRSGWLVIVMPSREWLAEYYHFSVLTHSQMKDLLYKVGFKLLAGPGVRSKIALGEGDIFYDLGRGWGHYDGYVAKKSKLSTGRFLLGEVNKEVKTHFWALKLVKAIIKLPYNKIRVWYARYHQE